MATQVERATQLLREAVQSGAYGADEKLAEMHLAEDLGMSRTVIRAALSALELEGLVTRTPNRGFRTRRFTLDEVADSIILRGEVEAIAARYACERGLSEEDLQRFETVLDEMADILDCGFFEVEHRLKWMELVAKFHDLLVECSGSSAIRYSIDHLKRIPLVAPYSVMFDLSSEDYSLGRIRTTFEMRQQIVEALRLRQAGRASALMIAYAYQACNNKRESVEAMRSGREMSPTPGLGLIAQGKDGQNPR